MLTNKLEIVREIAPFLIPNFISEARATDRTKTLLCALIVTVYVLEMTWSGRVVKDFLFYLFGAQGRAEEYGRLLLTKTKSMSLHCLYLPSPENFLRRQRDNDRHWP